MFTIGEAKEFLRQNWVEGEHCPVCHQYVRLYKIKISDKMAQALFKLYFNYPEPMHVRRFGLDGGTFAKMAHWGLVKTEDSEDPAKKTSGFWKITQQGIAFCQRQLKVPKYCQLYNQKCYGFEGDKVSIMDCLKKENAFHYEKLMKGRAKIDSQLQLI